MNYQLFQYPLPAPDDLADLNTYIASHRVAQVTHHIAQCPSGPMLVFLVQTVAGVSSAKTKGATRTDYQAELDPADFAIFSRLRHERKRIAEEEGVPVYTVFTNAQLAEMVRQRVRSAEELGAISGIGRARVEKYAEAFLKHLIEAE